MQELEIQRRRPRNISKKKVKNQIRINFNKFWVGQNNLGH